MPESDLELLIHAARAAGEIASTFPRNALDIRDKGDGAGPVTGADLAVNAALHDILRSARPDYGWLSEESRDGPDRLTRTRIFVVDPIDGTRSFIEGGRTWSHALAVVENGVPVAGVVHLPLLDKLYAAGPDGPATLNGKVIAPSQRSALDGSKVLATRPSLEARHWPQGVPDLRRNHRPSLAYRLCLVAEGRFDAMFTFRPSWEWDIAAGVAILRAAGAVSTDMTGATLRFNRPDAQTEGVIAAGPDLHAALMRVRLGT